MNVLPVINGTLVLCPFQGNLHDTSGFGANMATLDAFSSLPGGLEQYGTLDTCLQAFKFDGSTKLQAPLFTPLQLTGDFTVEWLMKQVANGTQTFFCAANPAGRSGGAGPDRIGSLYTVFYSDVAAYDNEQIGSNIPSAGYGTFTGTNDSNWGTNGVHFYSFKRSGSTCSIYIDGVRITPDVTDIGPNVAAGNERFYVGGYEGPGLNMAVNTLFASFRVVNYARTDVQIAADSTFCLSGNCGVVPTFPVTDGGNSTSPDNGGSGDPTTGNIVYDGLAAAQFGLSLQQSPKA